MDESSHINIIVNANSIHKATSPSVEDDTANSLVKTTYIQQVRGHWLVQTSRLPSEFYVYNDLNYLRSFCFMKLAHKDCVYTVARCLSPGATGKPVRWRILLYNLMIYLKLLFIIWCKFLIQQCIVYLTVFRQRSAEVKGQAYIKL